MSVKPRPTPNPALSPARDSAAALCLRLLWCALVLMLPFRWNYAAGLAEMAFFPTNLWQWLLFTCQPHFLLSLLAGGLLLATLCIHRRPPPLTAAAAIPALTLLPPLAGLAGLVNTTETAYAFQWHCHFLTIATVSWGIWWTSQNDRKLLPWLATTLALGALLTTLQGWTQHFGGLEENLREQMEFARHSGRPLGELMEAKMRQTRSLGSFGDPNAYAAQLLLACPFLAWGALRLGRRCRPAAAGMWLLGGAALLLSLGALVFSGSRGAILGALAGGVLAALAGWGNRLSRRGLLALLLLAALAGTAMVALLNHLSHRRLETVSVRLEYYRTAGEIFRRHPWTGAGLGEFYPWHLRLKGWEADEARDAHSLFFAQLAQCGVAGAGEALLRLLAPLLLTLWLLRQARRNPQRTPGALAVAALGAWGAWTAHAMVQFNDMVVSTATLAGFLGLLAFENAPAQCPPQRPACPPVAGRLLSLCLLLLALFSLAGLLRMPGERAFQEAEDAMLRPTASYAARKALWIKAMEASPHLPAPARRLADMALSQGDLPATRMALAQLQERAPHRSATAFRLWRLALLEENPQEAAKAREQLALWNPTSLPLWLSRCLESQGLSTPSPQLAHLISLPLEKKSVEEDRVLVYVTLPSPPPAPYLLEALQKGVEEDLSHRTLTFLPKNP